MSGEIIAALIGVGASLLASQVAMWLRLEHRLTVLETKLGLMDHQHPETPPVRIRRAFPGA